ncbi:MAG TPA: branched-chain amino acid ABC transporter permease, partial [Clostridiales bacterium]|nr:branched-chain amino acid ABC transporter permease [Clostridiales bacterium]
MTFQSFLQQLANGISLGSLYALIAIGYTMVYGILRLINFAHGDIFMMAAYFMVFSVVNFGLPWYIASIIVILATVALGVLLEKAAYSTLRDAPRMSIMISAIGASFLLENLATYLFTGVPKGFPNIAIL